MTEVVTSPGNARVVAATKLHDRKGRAATGLTLLEGPHLIDEAAAAGVTFETVFVLEGEAVPAVTGEVVVVNERVLRKLSPTEHPRGPVGVFRPDPQPVASDHCLVLWGLADPGNVGTLIRTAAAFGVDVLATPDTTDLWAPKVIRAGAGGHFRVGIDVVDSVPDLAAMGYRIIAAVSRGGAWPDEVRVGSSAALVVGNEARGLPEEVAAAADVRVSIRMPGGAESFNAAVAGSILAYALFGR